MAESPSIEQIVAQIRTALFGKDVRENIALGIEKIYDITSSSINAYFILGTRPDRYITYNVDSGELVFPNDSSFYYNNQDYSIPNRTLNVKTIIQQYYAACIWVLNNHTITATAFNTRPSSNYNPALLGYVYGNNVSINGAYNERIQIIDNIGNRFPQNYKNPQGSAVIVHEGIFYYGDFGGIGSVIYDRVNNTITLSGDAYCVYRGVSLSNRPKVIDLSVVSGLSPTFYAFKLYMTSNGDIYPTSWNAVPQNKGDDFIGYGYNSVLWINGVPQYAIEDVSNYKKVFCFGDSIVAGYQTNKAFHMIYHTWNRNIHCYNYGVGGSGYAYSNPDGTTPNGIEYKYREQDLVDAPSDNTVKGMMEYVDASMDNILIFAGTNDYGTSISRNEFVQAVQDTLDYALTKTKKIFVITPIKRYYPNQSGETPNSAGMKLSDYAQIIKEECDNRGIICVNGYDVGLDPSVTEIRQAFVTDGLHPNADGHYRIARNTYSKFLEAICI